jgi:hypothetical protein
MKRASVVAFCFLTKGRVRLNDLARVRTYLRTPGQSGAGRFETDKLLPPRRPGFGRAEKPGRRGGNNFRGVT